LRDISDGPLGDGAFTVAMTAVAEPPRRGQPAGVFRFTRQVVAVALPYDAKATSVVFTRAVPSDMPPEKWDRVAMGAWPLVMVIK
jgi:hypothetical protein